MNLLISTILRRLLWGYNFRGKGRLLSFLSPDAGEIDTILFGSKVRLDLGDMIQREMVTDQAFRRRAAVEFRRGFQLTVG